MPDWPYEIRIKFSGGPPYSVAVKTILQLVLEYNSLALRHRKHAALRRIVDALWTWEEEGSARASTVTLEIPNEAYSRVKKKRPTGHDRWRPGQRPLEPPVNIAKTVQAAL